MIGLTALLPLLCLSLGAVLLVLITSLLKDHLFRGFDAAFTVLSALAGIGTSVYLWQRIQDEGPSSTVAGAVAPRTTTLSSRLVSRRVESGITWASVAESGIAASIATPVSASARARRV